MTEKKAELGTPEQCAEACRRYEAAGVDLLLCLVNPFKISHASVMQTIELMGWHGHPAVPLSHRHTDALHSLSAG